MALVSFWRLREATGVARVDSRDGNNLVDGTSTLVIGDGTGPTAIINRSAKFSRLPAAYLAPTAGFPTNLRLGGLPAWTFVFWFSYVATPGTEQHIWGLNDTTTGWLIFFPFASNKLSFFIQTGTGGVISSQAADLTQAWHLVAVKGTNTGTVSIKTDNNPWDNFTGLPAITDTIAPNPGPRMGHDTAASIADRVAAFGMWNEILSDAVIADIYSKGYYADRQSVTASGAASTYASGLAFASSVIHRDRRPWMAKTSGMGDLLLLGGYDLTGDVGSVGMVRGGPKLLDVTSLDEFAYERISGLRDGEIQFNAFFNAAASRAHVVLSALPTADVMINYLRGSTVGNSMAGMIGKQINYDPKLGQDRSLIFTIQCLANALGLEWGAMLTAGKQTLASTGAGTAFDWNTPSGAVAVTITSSSVANPTVITTATAHGLVTGDSIVIAGHTGSTPSLNNNYAVTVLTATTFTIPVNVTVGGTGGTMTKTSTDAGATSYLQVMSIATNTMDLVVQHSADNGVTDAYATITGLAHTNVNSAVNGGRTTERLTTTATLPIKRWTRINATNTFTNAILALELVRY